MDIINFLGIQGHQSSRRSKMRAGATPSRSSIPSYIGYVYEKSKKTGERQIKRDYWKNPETGEMIKSKGIKAVKWPSKSMTVWLKKYPTARVMRVFNMMPVFDYKPADNERMYRSKYLHDPLIEGMPPMVRNPNEIQFGSHGCICCPYKSWEYYDYLKKYYPRLYAIAIRRRDLATQLLREKGEYISKKTGKVKKRTEIFTQFGGQRFTRTMAEAGYTRDNPPF